MVARGVKRGKVPKFALLQPFIPLLISWQGKGALYSMTQVELDKEPNFLRDRKLISGLYINELLVRLLASGDPHIDLFDFYQQAIQNLVVTDTEQVVLRLFEKRLLMTIGYELPLIKDVVMGSIVSSDYYYFFDLEQGPQKIEGNPSNLSNFGDVNVLSRMDKQTNIFKGSSLLALHNEELHTKEELQDAKKLLRMALALRLGSQPLHTRKLLYIKV